MSRTSKLEANLSRSCQQNLQPSGSKAWPRFELFAVHLLWKRSQLQEPQAYDDDSHDGEEEEENVNDFIVMTATLL